MRQASLYAAVLPPQAELPPDQQQEDNQQQDNQQQEEKEKFSEGLQYTLSSDQTYYTLSGIGTCSDTQIVIPATYNNLSVKEIGAAFEDCALIESVTIPAGVVSIGGRAFAGCTSLSSITIPNGITSIGGKAFSGCTSLAAVTIPQSVTGIGGNAFSGCTSLKSITIPNGITSIGSGILSGCTSIESVTLPFVDSKNIATQNAYFGHLFGAASYEENSSAVPSSLKSVTIAAVEDMGELKRLCPNAFSGCASIESVTLPDGLKGIRQATFENCTSLKNITIPDSVESIAPRSFSGCTSLTKINVPKALTKISALAFENCNSLKDLYLSDIGGWCAIEYLDNLMDYGTAKTIYLNNQPITELTIPNSATNVHAVIGRYAFENCTSITDVVIEGGITEIGKYVFSSCTSLKNIIIPQSVTRIGYGALSGCTSLTSITYNGTKAQWEEVTKSSEWYSNTGAFTIHCTDGDVAKP